MSDRKCNQNITYFTHRDLEGARIEYRYFEATKQYQVILYQPSHYPIVRAYKEIKKARKDWRQWKIMLEGLGYTIKKD